MKWFCSIALLAFFGLAGCTTSDDFSDAGAASLSAAGSASNAAADVSPEALASAQDILTTASVSPGSGDYQLAPLDVIDVTVFQVPDLNRTAQVNTSGMVSLPLIGLVPVAGKTTVEVEQDLAARFGATYLQNPQVGVAIKEAASQRITIGGAVNKPGVFPIAGETTLLQAMAMAEGLTEVGDRSGVIILRGASDRREIARFDLDAIRTGSSPDPTLLAGDVVMVDESRGRTALRDLRSIVPIAGLFRLF